MRRDVTARQTTGIYRRVSPRQCVHTGSTSVLVPHVIVTGVSMLLLTIQRHVSLKRRLKLNVLHGAISPKAEQVINTTVMTSDPIKYRPRFQTGRSNQNEQQRLVASRN
jgi:hypothetical protein